MNNLPILYRPPTEGDLSFIVSSWLKSQRNSDFSNFISNQIYYRYNEHLIKKVIERSMISIICDPEDPNHVYGYAVYEFLGDIFVLNFIYIKYTYRNMKLAYNLLKAISPKFGEEEAFITFIDRTDVRVVTDKGKPDIRKSSFFIKNREKYKLNFNPFLLIR